jgi:hypothetical protein
MLSIPNRERQICRIGICIHAKFPIRIREDQEQNGSHGFCFEILLPTTDNVLKLGEHVRVKLRIRIREDQERNRSHGSGFEILLPTPEKVLKLGDRHRIDRGQPAAWPPSPHRSAAWSAAAATRSAASPQSQLEAVPRL